MESPSTFGFIILRHVNSHTTDQLWKNLYVSIRKFYPTNKIVIIDDNSSYTITQIPLFNTILIQSEFPGRGELLPYYYYCKYNWFDNALILHDSTVIHKKFSWRTLTYRFLFHFETHDYDDVNRERQYIQLIKNHQDVLDLYDSGRWNGCFGMMTSINRNFLKLVNAKYGFHRLIPYVKSRDDRMRMERVVACMLQTYSKKPSILGCIHDYPIAFKYNYKNYIKDCKSDTLPNYPVIKIWVGR